MRVLRNFAPIIQSSKLFIFIGVLNFFTKVNALSSKKENSLEIKHLQWNWCIHWRTESESFHWKAIRSITCILSRLIDMVLCGKETNSIMEEYFHWSEWWSCIHRYANNCIRRDKHWLRYSTIWRWTPDQMGLAPYNNSWFCQLFRNVVSVRTEDSGQSSLLWLLFVCRPDLFHSNWYVFPTTDGISSIWRPNRVDRRDYDEWLQVHWRWIRLGTIENVERGKFELFQNHSKTSAETL